jgi:hypothetical protein
VGRGDRHPPRLGQPPRRLPDRPGAGAAGRVGVEPVLQGQQVGLGQPRWSPGAGAAVEAGEALGGEALDELAHRLVVVAEGAGGLGDSRPVGDGGDHPQALMHGVRRRAGAQPTVEFGPLASREGDAEGRLHRGASFRPP